ncbi:monovalent cation:proton antiporter-2 (CPA2) family protein [Thalassomonas haliotis]|uniref:Cation:proton antiporter n=1 Tax=Thalassomonas haliotis TaxID=485448 RepID=A0ABY7V8X0_9GAMM|nr:monovalent cation:proton antiporter-2 (CPA2) family protein [Thalassomonas haliotis]WDE09946.1 cation:proton antiporter [Thalassomonas haliotis]
MAMGLMEQAFVFLGAGVVTVPIAKRLGLGSVLGYLIAGVIIGPYVLGIVGSHLENVMHFAEFGVVMMLFLVGLELQPSILWKLRVPIVGLGGAQVLLSTALLSSVALLFGLSWQMALAVGMILALSSTAIVLQLLNENGLMKTELGQSSFAVLLFQDIAVIPMLALMPLLAISGAAPAEPEAGQLTGYLHALQLIAVIGGIILAGKFLLRPLFRIIAQTKMREIFTATALFLVVGIALLMDSIGVSAALGTFLAGVVLAESEYRHELEAEIAPFKGLLLGLFFISVGASINFAILQAKPVFIIGLVFGLIFCKMLVLFVLGKLFKMQGINRWFFSFALAQSGEFCFVLFTFASQHHILTPDITEPLVVVVALSMAVTPLLMIVNNKLVEPLFSGADSQEETEADHIDDGDTPVILAGMGRFGQIVSRLLIMKGHQVTVLEHDATQVELVRKFENKVFYGDASRPDLLHAAGAETAKLLIVAVDEHEKTQEIVEHARKHYPHLKILVRAVGRLEVHELQESGADIIVRETFHSALNLAEQALTSLGVDAEEARRSAAIFKEHDERNIIAMAKFYGDEKGYRSQSQENYRALAAVLQADSQDVRAFNQECDQASGKCPD